MWRNDIRDNTKERGEEVKREVAYKQGYKIVIHGKFHLFSGMKGNNRTGMNRTLRMIGGKGNMYTVKVRCQL